jgi:hypothetical protein
VYSSSSKLLRAMMISSYVKCFLLVHSAYATSDDQTKGVKLLSASDALLLVQLRASSVDGQVQVGHGSDDSFPVGTTEERSMAEGDVFDREKGPIHLCKNVKHEGPKCPKEQELWWLHIPKAGSSFRGSVHLCNTERTLPGVIHAPVPASRDDALGHVAAMFREPSQRLASAWCHLNSGASCECWGCDGDSQSEIKRKIRNGSTAATDDFLGKSYLGCQTNMVIGKTCMAGTPSDPQQDAKRAMDRVDKFFFVGLLEEWALSICLFNYKITGVRFVSQCQLADSRPTSSKTGEAYDTSGYPRDVADETLYAHVVKRFNKELSLHGISKQSCSFNKKGKPFHEFISQEFWPDLV